MSALRTISGPLIHCMKSQAAPGFALCLAMASPRTATVPPAPPGPDGKGAKPTRSAIRELEVSISG